MLCIRLYILHAQKNKTKKNKNLDPKHILKIGQAKKKTFHSNINFELMLLVSLFILYMRLLSTVKDIFALFWPVLYCILNQRETCLLHRLKLSGVKHIILFVSFILLSRTPKYICIHIKIHKKGRKKVFQRRWFLLHIQCNWGGKCY